MFAWLVNTYDPAWSADLWAKFPDAEAAAVGVVWLAERRDISPAVSERGAAIAAGALWQFAAPRWPNAFGQALARLIPAGRYSDLDAFKTMLLVRARAGLFVVPGRSNNGRSASLGVLDPKIVAHAIDPAKAREAADLAGFRRAGGLAWCVVYNAFSTPVYIPSWRKRGSMVKDRPGCMSPAAVVDGLNLATADRLLLGWGRPAKIGRTYVNIAR
jgi:hypothetical protein